MVDALWQSAAWLIIGAAAIVCGIRSVEPQRPPRLRWLRARWIAALVDARRFRLERAEHVACLLREQQLRRDLDAANAQLERAEKILQNRSDEVMVLARSHVAYLRARGELADEMIERIAMMRTALELIADGCELPQAIAADALELGKEESCELN